MTVIALAWRRRQPDTPTKVYLKEGSDIHAKNIEWQEEQSDDETGEIVGQETWRSLEGWQIGVCPCDRRYDISDRGRLRNPQGDISSGAWWDGRFWCAVKGAGLLDLTSAAKRRHTITISPAMERAMAAFRDGTPPSEYAEDNDIKINSAWSAYSGAVKNLPPQVARRGCQKMVPPDLWDALMTMKKNGDARLGASLTELLHTINDEHIRKYSKRPFHFEMLRLARMCITL
jgi:hypothetical protein